MIRFMAIVNVPGGINVISECNSSYLYLRRQATHKRERLIFVDSSSFNNPSACYQKLWSAHLLRWLNWSKALSSVVPCDSSNIARSSLISAVSLGGR